MHKIFALKTILITLLGTSIATSLISLPVRANQTNFVNQSSNYDLAFNPNWSDYSPRGSTAPTENFKQIVGITFLALGTGVIAWHLTGGYKPSVPNSLLPIHNHNNSLLDRVSPKLRQQLLRLVHHPPIANRLLSGTLSSNPGRSPNWLAEKVIYDLQRDRS